MIFPLLSRCVVVAELPEMVVLEVAITLPLLSRVVTMPVDEPLDCWTIRPLPSRWVTESFVGFLGKVAMLRSRFLFAEPLGSAAIIAVETARVKISKSFIPRTSYLNVCPAGNGTAIFLASTMRATSTFMGKMLLGRPFLARDDER